MNQNFHRALSFAARHKLPCVVVPENGSDACVVLSLSEYEALAVLKAKAEKASDNSDFSDGLVSVEPELVPVTEEMADNIRAEMRAFEAVTATKAQSAPVAVASSPLEEEERFYLET